VHCTPVAHRGPPMTQRSTPTQPTSTTTPSRADEAAATRLRLATELANIVVWRHDLKADRVEFDAHGHKVLGIEPRPDGHTLAEARATTHPEDLPKLAAATALALATGEPTDVEVRHRRGDGVWRSMLVRRVVERDAAGEAIAFVGVTLDVTEQVEESRRAEQLALRLEAAAAAARIGIWTTVLGTHRTEWNAQMYELFDRPPAEGTPTLEAWLAGCVHADDAARVAATTRAFRRGELRAFELEFRSRRRDGRVRWMVLRADLDRNRLDPARAIGIAIDVTDRHEALDALHAASQRAALIARHAGIGTWETDAQGHIEVWDEQMWHLRGLAPRGVAPDTDERLSLMHPDDRARTLDFRPEMHGSPDATAYEFRIRLADGRYRWLASRSMPLHDEQGRFLRRVGVNWDVTETKESEAAKQQALLAERESEAKSQFLARMSHELRTPLNAVLGFTQLMQRELDQGHIGDAAAKLRHIRAAGEHLLTLVDDALDLSGLQAGSFALELLPVRIDEAVADTVPLVQALAAGHGVTLQCGVLEGTARADASRLRQALLNIMTTAVRHNRVGGGVAISSRAEGARVRLELRDTGRGFTDEQLAHLFEPFHRVDGEGTGIGLAIVKALVERMGGQITAASEPGRGTVFEIVLPRAEAAAAAVPNARRGQLLYIEDNSVNVLLVEELVKSLAGLAIASEPTGAAGVARARRLRPDLVLVDMQLPDFDGHEVLRRLRAQPETATVPCIALSANAMHDEIARALVSGFDDYWTKPIKFKPFIEALERRFPLLPPNG
jgi:PAS domain S-box-containing protein